MLGSDDAVSELNRCQNTCGEAPLPRYVQIFNCLSVIQDIFSTFDENNDGNIDWRELEENISVVGALGLEIMRSGMERYGNEGRKGHLTRK